mmetsp:Transcript_3678/g.10117  ORF Transcript_3678/g.10117 Transcript_3678/m.10117 type:complete len:95 (+) Transcript_3678:1470-1754(+)
MDLYTISAPSRCVQCSLHFWAWWALRELPACNQAKVIIPDQAQNPMPNPIPLIFDAARERGSKQPSLTILLQQITKDKHSNRKTEFFEYFIGSI